MDRCDGSREVVQAVVVVMVPFPAQGHLNQLLHFSRLISERGIPVHYIGSAVHNRQARTRVHGWDPCTISNINFHDFLIPPFVTPPPNPLASNKFPAHLQPTFNASIHLRKPLATLLQSLSSTSRRVAIIHDTAMAFAAEEANSIPNAKAYAFHSVSAFAILFYKWELLGKPEGIGIPNDLPELSIKGCFTEEFIEFINSQHQLMDSIAGILFNTCRPIEGTFIDLLSQETLLGNKKIWAVGPFNPLVIKSDEGSHQRHKCLEWLDTKPLNSVIYVSFGTMASIDDEQINELALGLEQSKTRFIWVLREADRGDIYAGEEEARRIQLPDGYKEGIEGVGMIVRDWAPQLEILAHPSTGGFLSHCGWNSCIESLSMGVPIAAWPMHSDQPRNTMLVTEVLKVGLVVREWEHRENLRSSADIGSAVRKLMASEEGNEMRRRAEELGSSVRLAVSKEGTSMVELDSFLTYISI